MMQMKTRHDQNLAEISLQLFKLQSNLMTKERYLGELIEEREQVRSDCIIWGFYQQKEGRGVSYILSIIHNIS